MEPETPSRGPLFWVAVTGGVVAAVGVIALLGHRRASKNRRRRLKARSNLRKRRNYRNYMKARKAIARVKGGLLTALLAGAASRVGQAATSRVVG